MSQEDCATTAEGATHRRILRLDGATFPTGQDQDHDSEGGLGQHRLAADIRPYACRPHRTMSLMYEIGGKEHLEGECAGQAEGYAQEDVLVAGAVDLEA
jgi:hypothetical protein